MDKKVRRRRGGTIFRHLAEVSILQQALASSTLCCFRLLSALLSGSEAAGPHGFSSESTGCAVVPALAAPLPLASGNNSSSCCPLALESAVASCNDLVQFSSVAQSCPTLCDPMNRSIPGLPVHHQLPKFTETHVRQVSDANQPSHPLSSPSPPAPNPC